MREHTRSSHAAFCGYRSFFAVLVLFMVMSGPFLGRTAAASETLSLKSTPVLDGADLLTPDEEEALEKKLTEIRDEYGTDVVVATSSYSASGSAGEEAERILVENGFGTSDTDGAVILYIDMGSRSWSIRTRGSAISAFTDAGQEYIAGQFRPYLSSGEYNKAFTAYGDLSGRFLKQAATGKPYDIGNMPKKQFTFLHLLIALATGAAIALVIVLIIKSNLKSVHFQAGAADYMQKNSFHLTRKEDLFLYDTVTRVKRVQNENRGGGGGSSTHMGSGGHTFGGSDGHF